MTKLSDLGYPKNVPLSLKTPLVPKKTSLLYLKKYSKKCPSGTSKNFPPGTPKSVHLVPQKVSPIQTYHDHDRLKTWRSYPNIQMKKRDPPSITMGVSFLYLFDWMSPPFLTVIAIIFMSDKGTRGTVFGVPGGRFLGYQRDIFWGTGDVFFRVQGDVFWVHQIT